ncbi:MAG TPA: PKD domain-containing protein, partial [Microbacterium sp.]|nr:PKD domain-containing protein [Microbacterium sp.]
MASIGESATPARRSRTRSLVIATGVTIAALFGALVVAPPASADTAPPPEAVNAPATVSADPLPTVQINGVAWTQAVAGTTVFAGGEFTSARPAGAAPGTSESPRSNLLAYDIATGVMNSSFAPAVNGRILGSAVSPDGSRLYIAGGFTSVDGAARYRVAAFDTASGALIANWAPGTNGVVNDIVATNTTVYLAGEFSNVNNTARTRVAAVSAQTGAVLPFNPVLAGGYGARAVVVSPDASKVVIGGSFTSTNGSTNPGRGLAALDATTGASLPWAVNSVIRNAGTASAIYSLASDGDSVYGTGYDFGGSKTEDDFEGSFRASWADGAMVWMEDCHGDSYSVFPFKGAVYKADHTHYCGNIGEFPQLNPWKLNYSLAFSKEPSDRAITPDIWGYRSFTGNPAGRLLHWYPDWVSGSATGINQAGWDVTGSGDYLLYAGEFTRVSGVAQQGLVRFTTVDKAPNGYGPTILGGAWPITTTSFRAATARIGWQANYDPDNAQLTYEVFRRGVTAPVHTVKADSTFWVRPSMGFTDTGLVAGQTYEYRVRVTDPTGNSTQSDWSAVSVSATDTGTAYNQAIVDEQPVGYWPLSEASGTTAFDWVGANDVKLTSNVTRNVTGQVVGESSKASSFSGSNSFGVTTTARPAPDVFSVEAWFKTTSTNGGKIVGFGNAATGTSASYDRHIYINGQGRLTFGVYPGSVQAISSGTGYNDGSWHQVVGTLGTGGMEFFVDGVRIGALPGVVNGQSYSGYWRIGGDSVSSWPQAGSSYLNGQIADVAVYDRVLSREEVDDHRVASGRQSTIPAAPADAYGAAVYGASPAMFWRLGETSGTTAADSGREGFPGVYNSTSIVRGETGAIDGTSNSAIRFTSSKNGFGTWTNRQTVISARATTSPSTFAVEGWFKTTSTGGGKLIGFGNSNANTTNASGTYDRHVYMTPSGQLKFGTHDGTQHILTAPGTYRDGSWHHVVGQQSAAGMQLFVDGALVDSNTVSTASVYSGYWRLGGDTTWEGDPFWVGSLDDVAVYGSALSAAQVQQHFEAGTTGAVNELPTAEFSSVVTDLSVAFDATASGDAEGPLEAFDWDFGDGESGVGATATHVYDAAGTYPVTLTVRDSGGLESTVTHDVTVSAANALPTASFVAAVTDLSVAVDATASTDADGTIITYSWSFGDGANGSGVTAEHAYLAAGEYPVSLTVTDDRGGSATTTQQVSVAAPNVAPTAAFTLAVDAESLTVSVDAGTSADPDGTITSYAWDFGEGATGTGASATHTYDAPGSYPVTLTVTDDDGATHSVTHDASIVPESVIAADAFSRTATSSWGPADVGGTWTVSGGAAAFGVADGRGTITLAPSHSREARLTGVSSADSTVDVLLSADTAPAGGSATISVAGRVVGSSQYLARVRLEPGGVIRLYLLRNNDVLGGGSFVLPGAYVAGQQLHVRMSALGSGTTNLGAKVWVEGTPEPSAWQLQATDTTAELQAPGSISIRTSASAASTVPSLVLGFDDLRVVSGDVAGPPTPNQAPTASFTSTTDGLTVGVDASGSTDPDGSIAAATWDFGDGKTATGLTASNVYATAGTYTVTLTVTDDDGATATSTETVIVSDPPPANVVADDSFDRDVAGGWGS